MPPPPGPLADTTAQRAIAGERRKKSLWDLPARARTDSPHVACSLVIQTSTLPPAGERSVAGPPPCFCWRHYLEFDPCECRRAEDASLGDMEEALENDSKRAEPDVCGDPGVAVQNTLVPTTSVIP